MSVSIDTAACCEVVYNGKACCYELRGKMSDAYCTFKKRFEVISNSKGISRRNIYDWATKSLNECIYNKIFWKLVPIRNKRKTILRT